MKRPVIHHGLIFVALLVMATWVSAQVQPELDATYITTDGAFRFHYPGDWEVQPLIDSVTLTGDGISVVVIPPHMLGESGVLPEAQDIEDTVETFIDLLGQTFDFADPAFVALDSGEEGLRSDFKGLEPDAEAITRGFLVALPLDDSFAVVVAFTEEADIAEMETLVYAIIDTFEVGDFEVAGSVTGELPSLHDYNRGATTEEQVEYAVAELVDLGLISDSGDTIFTEDLTFSAFRPPLVINDESASDYPDAVMGALISFRPVEPGDRAVCGLLSRVTQDNEDALSSFLLVGATSSNTVIVVEQVAPETEPVFFETDVVTDFHQPQHLLYSAQDDELTVFLNGEAIIEKLPLQFSHEDWQQSTVLAGTNLDLGCVMTGIWAYGLALPSATARN